MSRPAEFDRNEVLQAAMSVFWKYGYEASSISKLLEEMQINRGSLYAAFGDKDGLFQEVMSVYVDSLGEWLSILKETENPVQAIEHFYEWAFVLHDFKTITRGCLLFNTVSELNARRPDLAAEAKQYLDAVRGLLHQRVEQAVAQGYLAKTTDVDGLADTLLVFLSGLRTFCKMGADKPSLEAVLATTLPNILKKQPVAAERTAVMSG